MPEIHATTCASELDVASSVPLAGWYPRWGKRLLDVVLSVAGLVLLSPFFLIVFCLAKLCAPGPFLYRQERVGKGGRVFCILKFRTMTVDADRNGPLITSAGDSRVTRFGQLLRRCKVDELPQLWNVLRGEMSLVGPRPEVPVYVAGYSAVQLRVLSVLPGITDLASLCYRDEELFLGRSNSPEQLYREVVLPHKLALNLEYLQRISLGSDLALLLKTLVLVLAPQRISKAEAANPFTG
jgi:lipopolysaccharide/colanic/teichoic acid biosynthesis glycosyltransferase